MMDFLQLQPSIYGQQRPAFILERERERGRGRERERMGVTGNLSADQLHSFNSNGFLVLESFSSNEEVQELRGRMGELLQQFDGCPSSVLQLQSTDDYFYDSAENISFFFEEKAFGDDGCLKQSKELSMSKVGHALHEMDPVFKKYSHSEKISAVLLSLGYRKPVIIQSTYIFKQPGIGGEVIPHQDNSSLYTEPPSCTGFWLALEDAAITNGCLWVIPGSHKNGLMRRFIRDEDGVHFDRPAPSYDKKEFIALEVKAGSLIFIHGGLVHRSFENQSPNSRNAFSLHVVETEGSVWPKENWIQRKRDPEPVYVS